MGSNKKNGNYIDYESSNCHNFMNSIMNLAYPDNHNEGDSSVNTGGVYDPCNANTTSGRCNHQEELLKSLCGDDENETGTNAPESVRGNEDASSEDGFSSVSSSRESQSPSSGVQKPRAYDVQSYNGNLIPYRYSISSTMLRLVGHMVVLMSETVGHALHLHTWVIRDRMNEEAVQLDSSRVIGNLTSFKSQVYNGFQDLHKYIGKMIVEYIGPQHNPKPTAAKRTPKQVFYSYMWIVYASINHQLCRFLLTDLINYQRYFMGLSHLECTRTTHIQGGKENGVASVSSYMEAENIKYFNKVICFFSKSFLSFLDFSANILATNPSRVDPDVATGCLPGHVIGSSSTAVVVDSDVWFEKSGSKPGAFLFSQRQWVFCRECMSAFAEQLNYLLGGIDQHLPSLDSVHNSNYHTPYLHPISDDPLVFPRLRSPTSQLHVASAPVETSHCNREVYLNSILFSLVGLFSTQAGLFNEAYDFAASTSMIEAGLGFLYSPIAASLKFLGRDVGDGQVATRGYANIYHTHIKGGDTKAGPSGANATSSAVINDTILSTKFRNFWYFVSASFLVEDYVEQSIYAKRVALNHTLIELLSYSILNDGSTLSSASRCSCYASPLAATGEISVFVSKNRDWKKSIIKLAKFAPPLLLMSFHNANNNLVGVLKPNTNNISSCISIDASAAHHSFEKDAYTKQSHYAHWSISHEVTILKSSSRSVYSLSGSTYSNAFHPDYIVNRFFHMNATHPDTHQLYHDIFCEKLRDKLICICSNKDRATELMDMLPLPILFYIYSVIALELLRIEATYDFRLFFEHIENIVASASASFYEEHVDENGDRAVPDADRKDCIFSGLPIEEDSTPEEGIVVISQNGKNSLELLCAVSDHIYTTWESAVTKDLSKANSKGGNNGIAYDTATHQSIRSCFSFCIARMVAKNRNTRQVACKFADRILKKFPWLHFDKMSIFTMLDGIQSATGAFAEDSNANAVYPCASIPSVRKSINVSCLPSSSTSDCCISTIDPWLPVFRKISVHADFHTASLSDTVKSVQHMLQFAYTWFSVGRSPNLFQLHHGSGDSPCSTSGGVNSSAGDNCMAVGDSIMTTHLQEYALIFSKNHHGRLNTAMSYGIAKEMAMCLLPCYHLHNDTTAYANTTTDPVKWENMSINSKQFMSALSKCSDPDASLPLTSTIVVHLIRKSCSRDVYGDISNNGKNIDINYLSVDAALASLAVGSCSMDHHVQHIQTASSFMEFISSSSGPNIAPHIATELMMKNNAINALRESCGVLKLNSRGNGSFNNLNAAVNSKAESPGAVEYDYFYCNLLLKQASYIVNTFKRQRERQNLLGQHRSSCRVSVSHKTTPPSGGLSVDDRDRDIAAAKLFMSERGVVKLLWRTVAVIKELNECVMNHKLDLSSVSRSTAKAPEAANENSSRINVHQVRHIVMQLMTEVLSKSFCMYYCNDTIISSLVSCWKWLTTVCGTATTTPVKVSTGGMCYVNVVPLDDAPLITLASLLSMLMSALQLSQTAKLGMFYVNIASSPKSMRKAKDDLLDALSPTNNWNYVSTLQECHELKENYDTKRMHQNTSPPLTPADVDVGGNFYDDESVDEPDMYNTNEPPADGSELSSNGHWSAFPQELLLNLLHNLVGTYPAAYIYIAQDVALLLAAFARDSVTHCTSSSAATSSHVSIDYNMALNNKEFLHLTAGVRFQLLSFSLRMIHSSMVSTPLSSGDAPNIAMGEGILQTSPTFRRVLRENVLLLAMHYFSHPLTSLATISTKPGGNNGPRRFSHLSKQQYLNYEKSYIIKLVFSIHSFLETIKKFDMLYWNIDYMNTLSGSTGANVLPWEVSNQYMVDVLSQISCPNDKVTMEDKGTNPATTVEQWESLLLYKQTVHEVRSLIRDHRIYNGICVMSNLELDAKHKLKHNFPAPLSPAPTKALLNALGVKGIHIHSNSKKRNNSTTPHHFSPEPERGSVNESFHGIKSSGMFRVLNLLITDEITRLSTWLCPKQGKFSTFEFLVVEDYDSAISREGMAMHKIDRSSHKTVAKYNKCMRALINGHIVKVIELYRERYQQTYASSGQALYKQTIRSAWMLTPTLAVALSDRYPHLNAKDGGRKGYSVLTSLIRVSPLAVRHHPKWVSRLAANYYYTGISKSCPDTASATACKNVYASTALHVSLCWGYAPGDICVDLLMRCHAFTEDELLVHKTTSAPTSSTSTVSNHNLLFFHMNSSRKAPVISIPAFHARISTEVKAAPELYSELSDVHACSVLSDNSYNNLHTVPAVVQYCIRSFKALPLKVMIFYLPQLVQLLRRDTYGAIHGLIAELSSLSAAICHQVMWLLQTESVEEQEENGKKRLPGEMQAALSEALAPLGSDNSAPVCSLKKRYGRCKELLGCDPLPQTATLLISFIRGSLSEEALNYLDTECGYFNSVTNISALLTLEPDKSKHNAIIKTAIEKLGQLPGGIYMPSVPSQRVLNVDASSGIPMQSAAKCPYLLFFHTEAWDGPDSFQIKPTQEPEEDDDAFGPIASNALSTPVRPRPEQGLVKSISKNRGIGKKDGSFSTPKIMKPLVASVAKGAKDIKKIKPKPVNTVVERNACIFKVYDDCRQDALTMQIIQVLKAVYFSLELPVHLVSYGIIPNRTGANNAVGGILEVIKNVHSRHQMGSRDGYKTLKEFYIQKFGIPTSVGFRKAQLAFAGSLAAYSVVCYLLWVKDRHNGNIMYDEEGHVVHIDFGFLLGISPGGNLGFESAAFKFSKEMVEMLDGLHSEVFDYFATCAVRAFLVARRYTTVLTTIVGSFVDSGLPCFMYKTSALEAFKNRFFPCDDDLTASAKFRALIFDAANKWTTCAYDGIQKLQNDIYSEYWH